MNKQQFLRQYFRRTETFLNRHSSLVFWSMLALASILLISRQPNVILHPQFWAEDGKYWYAEAYNNGLRSLFYVYNGYFVFTYHLVGALSLGAPLRYAPLLFNLIALGVQLLPVVLINSSRMRSLVRYRSLAILISFLYVSVPNAGEVFGNLTNIQWHLGVAAFLVLVSRKATSLWWHLFDIAILLALGLSGPLVIMLLPISIYLWWHNHTIQEKRNSIVLVALSILQLVTIFILSPYHRVGGQPDANLRFLVEMIVGQIFTGGLLGQQHVNLLYGSPIALGLALFVGMALIGYAVFRGPRWLKLAWYYVVLIFISMLASLRPAKGLDVWWGLANPGGGQRYWYIPILAWIFTILWLVLASKNRTAKYSAGALLALLLLVGVPGNWRIAAKPNQNYQAYVKTFEKLPGGTRYSIPVNPGWQMVLYKK